VCLGCQAIDFGKVIGLLFYRICGELFWYWLIVEVLNYKEIVKFQSPANKKREAGIR
jgi:hypothetical protein